MESLGNNIGILDVSSLLVLRHSNNSVGVVKNVGQDGNVVDVKPEGKRGYTTFLVSSYWLKKLLVIPEYNYVLFNLVYNLRNNKHIIFAIWLAKLPNVGTVLKLSTLNKKFGLNYKTANDFCFKFLKLARINLDKYNNLSFNYRYKADSIYIIPYETENISKPIITDDVPKISEITKRLSYFRRRFGLEESEMKQFFHQYRNFLQTRILIEKAFKRFIRVCRLKRINSTIFQGISFLKEIQKLMIEIYQESRTGKLIPNG